MHDIILAFWVFGFIWSGFCLFVCFYTRQSNTKGFPCGSAGKESTCNEGDVGSISGLGRSSGEGKGYPLQYSDLENSMNCIVHGVTKSQTRLSDFHFQSSTKAWRRICSLFSRYALGTSKKAFGGICGALTSRLQSVLASEWSHLASGLYYWPAHLASRIRTTSEMERELQSCGMHSLPPGEGVLYC